MRYAVEIEGAPRPLERFGGSAFRRRRSAPAFSILPRNGDYCPGFPRIGTIPRNAGIWFRDQDS
jgi:hypothetical protein